MQLTQKQTDSIKIPNNLCLIKLPQAYSLMVKNHYQHQLTKDLNIKIDTSFDPATHAPRFGTLIKLPKRLIFDKTNKDTMTWKTKMQAKEGDRVFFDYLACLTALGKLANPSLSGELPTWFRCGDDIYIFMRYDALIFAMRTIPESKAKEGDLRIGEKFYSIICLNGHVILAPVVSKVESTLHLPKHLQYKEEKLQHMVVYSGQPNEGYLDGGSDGEFLTEGELVVIKNYRIRLENDLSNILVPGLVYVQQKYVWATITQ